MTRIIYTLTPHNYSTAIHKAKSANQNQQLDFAQKTVNDMFAECALRKDEKDKRAEAKAKRLELWIRNNQPVEKPIVVKGKSTQRLKRFALTLLSSLKKVPPSPKPEKSLAERKVEYFQEKLNHALDLEASYMISSVPEKLYVALEKAEAALAHEQSTDKKTAGEF